MTCFQFSRAAERPPVLEYWIISKYWTTGALPHCCRFMLPCLHIRLQRHVIVATRLSLYAASTAKHMRCHCPYHLYQYFSNRLQKLFSLYIFSGFEPYIVPVGNMFFFKPSFNSFFFFSKYARVHGNYCFRPMAFNVFVANPKCISKHLAIFFTFL